MGALAYHEVVMVLNPIRIIIPIIIIAPLG